MIAVDLVIAKIPFFSTVMTFDGWNLPQEHVFYPQPPKILSRQLPQSTIIATWGTGLDDSCVEIWRSWESTASRTRSFTNCGIFRWKNFDKHAYTVDFFKTFAIIPNRANPPRPLREPPANLIFFSKWRFSHWRTPREPPANQILSNYYYKISTNIYLNW